MMVVIKGMMWRTCEIAHAQPTCHGELHAYEGRIGPDMSIGLHATGAHSWGRGVANKRKARRQQRLDEGS